MTNLKNKILDTVHKNNITMIPRWKFVVYSTLAIASLLFTFLLLVFVVSLLMFVLSRYGFMYMPFFKFMGTLRALHAIPSLLLILTVMLLILIEIISRNYTFTFRRPLAITLLIITSLVAVISFFISQTPVHEYIRDYAKTHKIGFMSRAYDRPLPFDKVKGMTVMRGEVIETSSSSLVLKSFDGVLINAFATTTGELAVHELGTDVVILGSFFGNRFIVTDIRQAHKMPFRKGGKPMKRHESDQSTGSPRGEMKSEIKTKINQ